MCSQRTGSAWIIYIAIQFMRLKKLNDQYPLTDNIFLTVRFWMGRNANPCSCALSFFISVSIMSYYLLLFMANAMEFIALSIQCLLRLDPLLFRVIMKRS
jgi:hypothetical protein